MLHVLYLVHDVSDPAVRRRVLMLREGGARVTLAGFRRAAPIADIEGDFPIDLGRTGDGRFAQRVLAVASAAVSLGSTLGRIQRPDLIIARNLETLALAERAKTVLRGGEIPVVYESLDIHRLLLRPDLLGRAMRAAERYLARDSALLLTSSPAFVRDYFAARGQVGAPVEIIENRHFEPLPVEPSATEGPPAPPPWRIGWFGALRCSRSLQLLGDFSRRAGGRFETVLRGRPALSEFSDFHGLVDAAPGLSFKGPYRNPEDVEAIYREVHFSWVIDFFEEGQNSKWLLPNRLYEGCRFGAVPIAMAGTETARFLKDRGIGIILPEATPQALERALGEMSPDRFQALREKVLAQDQTTWLCTRDDCRALVTRLGRLAAAPRASPAEALASGRAG
jgi:succinoglycan biosynthesis protein ExoL